MQINLKITRSAVIPKHSSANLPSVQIPQTEFSVDVVKNLVEFCKTDKSKSASIKLKVEMRLLLFQTVYKRKPEKTRSLHYLITS